jgi:hypothetical protein
MSLGLWDHSYVYTDPNRPESGQWIESVCERYCPGSRKAALAKGAPP